MRETLAAAIMIISALAIFDVIDTPLIVDVGIFAVAVALVWTSARARSDRS